MADDICEMLKIGDTNKAVDQLDEDEKGSLGDTHGTQAMTIVNVSGLLGLILESQKPDTKRFNRWAAQNALLSIQKTGAISSLPTDWYTISSYIGLKKYRVNPYDYVALENLASELSDGKCYPIGSTPHINDVSIKTYHSDILEEVFERYRRNHDNM